MDKFLDDLENKVKDFSAQIKLVPSEAKEQIQKALKYQKTKNQFVEEDNELR